VGWLRAIRETLGMTSAALGQRLGITASGVRKLEQALRLAQQRQERTGRTMALEAQPVDAPSTSPRDRLEAMAQEILRSSGTRLWD